MDSSKNTESQGSIRLLSLIIYKWDSQNPILLSSTMDLSFFPFLWRSSIKERILIGSKWIVSETQLGTRQVIDFEGNLGRCHVHVHPSGLCAAAITSPAYPIRVAFGFLTEAIREFGELYNGKWEGKLEDVPEGTMFHESGTQLFNTYKNPTQADKILKVQKDLDEVKDVIKKNIDELMTRGDNLNHLSERANELSFAAKAMFKEAKRANQCCSWY